MRFQIRHVLLVAASSAVALTSTTYASAQPIQVQGSAEALAAQALGDPTWHEESPGTSPASVPGAAMDYDASDGRVILFGGCGRDGYSNETWAWDGSDWTQLHPKHSPPARCGHAMTYDPVREQLVMFGGDTADAYADDTWIFTGGDWSKAHPATVPYAVINPALEFDPALGQAVMFGGDDEGNNSSDNMWRWDGANWTHMFPSPVPRRRGGAGFVYDPSLHALVLFGGFDSDGSGPGTILRDTWTWDGTTWTQLNPRRRPPARVGPTMTTLGNGVAVFGGVHVRYLHDTWILKANSWRKVHGDASPGPRVGAPGAWDPMHHEAVLFSGRGDSGDFDDTWTLHR